MKENKNDLLSKRFWIILISTSVVLFIFFLICIILFVNKKPTIINKSGNGGEVKLNYTSNSNEFILSDITPMKDDDGKKTNDKDKVYDFSVSSKLKDSSNIYYEISAVKIPSKSDISDDEIVIYLEKEDSGSYNSVLKPSKYTKITKKSKIGTVEGMVLTKQVVNKSVTQNYRLRMWLSEKSSKTTGKYGVKINIKAIAE